MAADIDRARDELAALLQAEFRGRFLATGQGRGDNTFTQADIERTVGEFLANLAEPSELQPRRVVTGLTAADARAAGQPVPEEVPDWAVLECAGIEADLDTSDPSRINLSPKDGAWVWDTFLAIS